jgi:hypothetical protein
VDGLEAPSFSSGTFTELARRGTSRSGLFWVPGVRGPARLLHIEFVERAAWVQEYVQVVVGVVFEPDAYAGGSVELFDTPTGCINATSARSERVFSISVILISSL